MLNCLFLDSTRLVCTRVSLMYWSYTRNCDLNLFQTLIEFSLHKFDKTLIYTYIGEVVVSVNLYKPLSSWSHIKCCDLNLLLIFLSLDLKRLASTRTSGRWWCPWTPTNRWTFTTRSMWTSTRAGRSTSGRPTSSPSPTPLTRQWSAATRTRASSYQVRTQLQSVHTDGLRKRKSLKIFETFSFLFVNIVGEVAKNG